MQAYFNTSVDDFFFNFREWFNNEFYVEILKDTRGLALQESVVYICKGPGKRLRPLLFAAILVDFRRDYTNYLPMMKAIELLHLSSLVHDDLPALDDDNERRNRPTVHIKFKEHTAILAGDWLISYAFKIVAKGSQIDGIDLGKLINITSNLFMKLCEGQELDMKGVLTSEELDRMHSLKTGSIFEAIFLMSLLSENTMSFEGDLRHLGTSFGSLYQKVDDYLDVYAKSDITGRKVSSDIKNKKYCSKSLSKENLEQDIRELRSSFTDSFMSLHYRVLKVSESSDYEFNFESSFVNKVLDVVCGRTDIVF